MNAQKWKVGEPGGVSPGIPQATLQAPFAAEESGGLRRPARLTSLLLAITLWILAVSVANEIRMSNQRPISNDKQIKERRERPVGSVGPAGADTVSGCNPSDGRLGCRSRMLF